MVVDAVRFRSLILPACTCLHHFSFFIFHCFILQFVFIFHFIFHFAFLFLFFIFVSSLLNGNVVIIIIIIIIRLSRRVVARCVARLLRTPSSIHGFCISFILIGRHLFYLAHFDTHLHLHLHLFCTFVIFTRIFLYLTYLAHI